MTNMHIQVKDADVVRAIANLEKAGTDLTPAMRAIAQTLAYETEQNFAAGGRPKWEPLKNPSERRQGGAILQDTGQLAASITTDYSSSRAMIGSNKEYAAIHQFGGKAGRGKKVAIPARPYLAVNKGDGMALADKDRDMIVELLTDHLTGDLQ